jgi:hypothetical protein
MRADDFMPKDFLTTTGSSDFGADGGTEHGQTFDEELIRICENEGMTSNELEGFFRQLMNITERQILHSSHFSNHLTVLNRQLCQAAAVFLLVVSGSVLMSSADLSATENGPNTPSGPYELALGKKLVP